jgi:hypothetical protein
LGGAQVEVEQTGLNCIELVDHIEIECLDGAISQRVVEGIDQELND